MNFRLTLVFGIGIFSIMVWSPLVPAWTCSGVPGYLVVLCDRGVCKESFVIEFEGGWKGCARAPVLNPIKRLQGPEQKLITTQIHLTFGKPHGVYQVGWQTSCFHFNQSPKQLEACLNLYPIKNDKTPDQKIISQKPDKKALFRARTEWEKQRREIRSSEAFGQFKEHCWDEPADVPKWAIGENSRKQTCIRHRIKSFSSPNVCLNMWKDRRKIVDCIGLYYANTDDPLDCLNFSGRYGISTSRGDRHSPSCLSEKKVTKKNYSHFTNLTLVAPFLHKETLDKITEYETTSLPKFSKALRSVEEGRVTNAIQLCDSFEIAGTRMTCLAEVSDAYFGFDFDFVDYTSERFSKKSILKVKNICGQKDHVARRLCLRGKALYNMLTDQSLAGLFEKVVAKDEPRSEICQLVPCKHKCWAYGGFSKCPKLLNKVTFCRQRDQCNSLLSYYSPKAVKVSNSPQDDGNDFRFEVDGRYKRAMELAIAGRHMEALEECKTIGLVKFINHDSMTLPRNDCVGRVSALIAHAKRENALENLNLVWGNPFNICIRAAIASTWRTIGLKMQAKKICNTHRYKDVSCWGEYNENLMCKIKPPPSQGRPPPRRSPGK